MTQLVEFDMLISKLYNTIFTQGLCSYGDEAATSLMGISEVIMGRSYSLFELIKVKFPYSYSQLFQSSTFKFLTLYDKKKAQMREVPLFYVA